MKRVLVTGATGFVGAAMVRHLARRGWSVTATGRGTPPAALSQFADHYLPADLRNPLPQVVVDAVVHSAALASDSAGLPTLLINNLNGTRHVWEATPTAEAWVLISSSSVYDPRRAVHSEDEPCYERLLSPYGLSKRRAEAWLLAQNQGERSLSILRPRAIYGPGDRVLLPRLLRLVRGEKVLAPGGLRALSGLTHVDNLCHVAEQMARNATLGNTVLNVSDPQPYRLNEVVLALLKAVTGHPNLQLRPLPARLLRTVAVGLQQLRVRSNFTPFSVDAVTRDNALDLTRLSQVFDLQTFKTFENECASIAAWANGVGLEQLRNADAGLPWSVV